MVAVRRPLHMLAREHAAKIWIRVSILCIYVGAVIINLYQYFWFNLSYRSCMVDNATQGFDEYLDVDYGPDDYEYLLGPNYTNHIESLDACDSYSLSVGMDNGTNPILIAYVRTSVVLFAVIVIAAPLLLLILLSAILMYYLKKSGRIINNTESHPTIRLHCAKRERKVLFMIVVTITTFVVLNFPSGVVMCLHIYYQAAYKATGYAATYAMTQLSEVANFLVTMNKACNFVVYCSSSSYYRRQVCRLLCCSRIPCIRNHLPSRYFMSSSGASPFLHPKRSGYTPMLCLAARSMALTGPVTTGQSLRRPSRTDPRLLRIYAANDQEDAF